MAQPDTVDVATALELLQIKSIDKEFKALKNRTTKTQFKYSLSNATKKLRPYQTQAIENLRLLIREGSEVVGLQLPTGAGKTFVIHSFIYAEYLRKGGNVLVITPSWEIANQHAATVCQQFKGGSKRVCRLGGQGQLISVFDEFRRGMKGKVVITTSALFFAREASIREILNAGLIVVDEGHHGWKKKRLNAVQGLARTARVPLILLTATPPRNMESLPFAAQLKYLDLTPEYLVECEIVRLNTGQEFKPVIKNGILSQASRVEISSRETRIEKIVAESIAHLRGQTIYYAGSVREALGVVNQFTKHGISATVVHSKWAQSGDKINALAIEKFRRGDVQVLVNVQMLAMGFDVPRVETIIVARPVESDTLFTQMVGRGARPSEGKSKFLLIDVHDTIHKPEVAKIFEHKHIFYSDVKSDPATKATRLEVMPVRVLKPATFDDLTGFPFHEGQLDDLTLLRLPESLNAGQVVELSRAAWRR